MRVKAYGPHDVIKLLFTLTKGKYKTGKSDRMRDVGNELMVV
jgi:hypothetical protein